MYKTTEKTYGFGTVSELATRLVDEILTEEAWWVAVRHGKFTQKGTRWAEGVNRAHTRQEKPVEQKELTPAVEEVTG